MSEDSDIENEPSNIDRRMEIPTNEIIEPEPADSTLNPIDEENEFIYHEEINTLLCVGTSFNDIPQSIIDEYAQKTKILDISKNRFRSLDCLSNFPDLEELVLDENDLDDDHTIFPKLTKLHTLMLNKNRLQDIYKLVDRLRQAYPLLTHLSLLGNEACPYQITSASGTSTNSVDPNGFAQKRLEEDYQRYRHLLIFRLPTLKFLDASEISPDERRIAEHLGDILYSIAETKQSQSLHEEKKPNKRASYTPLPTNTSQNNYRVTVSKVRHNYHGEGSQGNKFVQDNDL